jgi:hypothetical protein
MLYVALGVVKGQHGPLSGGLGVDSLAKKKGGGSFLVYFGQFWHTVFYPMVF